jgi:hypothetical protein
MIRPQILEAAKEYARNASQSRVNGWDKFWCYARPTNKYIGTLTKITFEIGKKEVSQEDLLKLIQEEITKRIESSDSYFLAGFRAFSTNELFYQMEIDRDFIMNNLLDSEELLADLEKSVEYVKINELFQRVKDYQALVATHQCLLNVLYGGDK